MSLQKLANLSIKSSSVSGNANGPMGSLSSVGMQAINWSVMAVVFVLLAATSIFGKEVLDTFCANMQYDGTSDDVISEQSFQTWEMVMWGGLGAGIAPACVFAVLMFFNLGCAKGVFASSMILSLTLASALVAMSFGVEMQTHFRGLFCGLVVGIAMMAVVLFTGKGKVTGGSVMVQIGSAFLLFGGLATALGSFAISRIEPCNTHRGCFASSATDATDSTDTDGTTSQFTTVCDWTCCDDQSSSTTCAEYAATSAASCNDCQPCNIDTSINTKLWACTGTAIALAVVGLVLLVVRFAVPVP